MAWLSGWDYRKYHIITAASNAGTGYQVNITVYYGSGSDSDEDVYLDSKCKTDFGDIRFTDNDGSTELDYWMEDKTDSDNAKFWVKVDDDLGNYSATIYVYYGNSQATTTSNGTNTFAFFDDFNDGSVDGDKWINTDGALSESGGSGLFTGNGTARYVYQNSTNYPYISTSAHMRTSAKLGTAIQYPWVLWGLACGDSWDDFTGFYDEGGYNGQVRYRKDGVNSPQVDSNWDETDNFEIHDIFWTPSSVYLKINGTTVENGYCSNTTYIPTDDLGFAMWIATTGAVLSLDYVFIRHYVSPEPSHSVWGNEEMEQQEGDLEVNNLIVNEELLMSCDDTPNLSNVQIVADIQPFNGGMFYTTPTVEISGGGGSDATAVATVSGGSITDLAVTNGGSGYTSNPTVNISDGGGSGATATATVNGPVNKFHVMHSGSNYFADSTVDVSGGGGSGATATAKVNGSVTDISVITNGTGYTSEPTVNISGGKGLDAYATAVVDGGSVVDLPVTNGGNNYTSPPAVSITGGKGTDATATAIVDGGSVTDIEVNAEGDNYISTPTVNISGGGGSGATATAIVDGGSVTDIEVTNGGSNYMFPPTVSITGGKGTAATATAILSGGPVISITVTNGGSNYTSSPTINITGGGGSGAAATANVVVGSVTSILVTDQGGNYTTPPTVEIFGGGGSGAAATAFVGGGSVIDLPITNGGSNYISSPIVMITGGKGTDATATAVVSGESVTSITITNNGSNYIYNPIVKIEGGNGSCATAIAKLQGLVTELFVNNDGAEYVPNSVVNISGGGGSGVIAKIDVTGVVAGLTVTNGGSSYTLPDVTITGGEGSGATAAATVTGGIITSIEVTNGGSGYTSEPTVTVSPPPSGATADARATIESGSVSGIFINSVLPTGSNFIRLEDTNSNNYTNLFLITSSDNYDAPLLSTDQGFIIKKDLMAGGFLGSGQGAVLLNHGLKGNPTLSSPPCIGLMSSEKEYPAGASFPGGPEKAQLFTKLGVPYMYDGNDWVTGDFSGYYDTLFLFKADGISPANMNLGKLTTNNELLLPCNAPSLSKYQMVALTYGYYDGKWQPHLPERDDNVLPFLPGASYVKFKDAPYREESNMFIVTSPEVGNDAILSIDTGFIAKKDIYAGGVFMCSQGAVMLGHGLKDGNDPPKISLTHSDNLFAHAEFPSTPYNGQFICLTQQCSGYSPGYYYFNGTSWQSGEGISFPGSPQKWQCFVRTDYNPHILYQYNDASCSPPSQWVSLGGMENYEVNYDTLHIVRADGKTLANMKLNRLIANEVHVDAIKTNAGDTYVWDLANMPNQGTNCYVLTAQGEGNPPVWASVGSVAVTWTEVPSSIIPLTDDTYDLGSDIVAWHDIYSNAGHIDNLTADKVTNPSSELVLDSPIAIRTLRKVRINPEVDDPVLELRKDDAERVFLGHDGTDTFLSSRTGELVLGSPIGVTALRKLRINPEVDDPVLELRKNGAERVFLGHNATDTHLFSRVGELVLGSPIAVSTLCKLRINPEVDDPVLELRKDDAERVFLGHDGTNTYLSSRTGELVLDSSIAVSTLRKIRINPEVDDPVLELRKDDAERVFLGHNATDAYLYSRLGDLHLGSSDTSTTIVDGDLEVTGDIIGQITQVGDKGSDTTDANGEKTVTFSQAFDSTPLIFVQATDASGRSVIIDVTAKSTTQFSVKAKIAGTHKHKIGEAAATTGWTIGVSSEENHTHNYASTTGVGSSHRHSVAGTTGVPQGTASALTGMSIGNESSHTHDAVGETGIPHDEPHKHYYSTTSGSGTSHTHSSNPTSSYFATSNHYHYYAEYTDYESSHTHNFSGTSGAGSSHTHNLTGGNPPVSLSLLPRGINMRNSEGAVYGIGSTLENEAKTSTDLYTENSVLANAQVSFDWLAIGA